MTILDELLLPTLHKGPRNQFSPPGDTDSLLASARGTWGQRWWFLWRTIALHQETWQGKKWGAKGGCGGRCCISDAEYAALDESVRRHIRKWRDVPLALPGAGYAGESHSAGESSSTSGES